jgi:uncharacterized damage-inducible protein DinB
MHKFAVAILLSQASLTLAQTSAPAPAPTLKTVLLNELRATHNQKGWFVPVSVAVAGLTPEQAKWKDKSGNHSVMELANHLAFWDERSLVKFKGGEPPKFDGNNEETFQPPQTWEQTVQKLDAVLTDWEKAIEAADENTLSKWYQTIANLTAHNAYHIGEMIYVRRLQGAWNPENGVH